MIPNKKCILSQRLKEREWTQSKLSQETGIPQSIISRYCTSTTNFNINYLFAIVEVLGLEKIDDLFEDQD
ncbi:helix-turn-helix transcriptional regulator [Laceyella putida]|uniref:Helix-turn-helix transcriptional regulator n=1 Tax=Laceyella putida TaxID=110101 RepID=A0ABW2RR01_9BACL